MDLEFCVLGPLEVWHTGRHVVIGGQKQRRVLAALVLNAGRVVTLAQLVDAVWDGEPPATARKQVQNAVSALRRTPLAEVLAAKGPGYVLNVKPGQVDAGRFDQHVAEARAAREGGALSLAVDELQAGLALWRGIPLAGASGRSTMATAEQLEDRRRAAITAWAEMSLELGRHDAVADELTSETARYPLHEPLAGLLMLALYRAGRTAEALACFQRIRSDLVAELGIDPGPELHLRYQQILCNDPVLIRDDATAVARNYLPRDIGHFTGRTAELQQLLSIAGTSGSTIVQAIDGMPGVGKTTLAIHAGHRLASKFPDGQFFVDLHGYTAGRDPLTTDEALDIVLRVIGVSDAQIPKNIDEKAARWRAELAGRRALLILDNVLSSAQIRHLLPGSAGCAVVVTSRRRLVGLDTAAVLSLETLPETESIALFQAIAGPGHEKADTAALQQVAQLCGYLPLALGIAAARLRSRPSWTVSDLNDRLADDHDRPVLLQSEDHGVAAAFALSYQYLGPADQRMFRRLSLHPGSDIDIYAAAALADATAHETEQLLDSLCDVHLLTQHRPGRYRLHDLVRDYARMSAEADEPASALAAARERLLDYYLHVTEHAAEINTPGRRQLGPKPRHQPTATPNLTEPADVWAWIKTEQGNLLPISLLAARHSTAEYGWQIPRNLGSFLLRNGQPTASLEVYKIALAACRRDTELAVRSACVMNVGLLHQVLGEYRQALDYFNQAIALADEWGDPANLAVSLAHMADLSVLTGSYEAAAAYAARSMAIHRALNDQWRLAGVLTILMDALIRLGRFREAIAAADQANVNLGGFANQRPAGHILSRRGTAHSQLNEHRVALDLLGQSLEITRQGSDRRLEADYLHRFADALRRSGQAHEALTHAQEALAILQDDVTDPVDLTETHNVLGAIYLDLHQHDLALDHYRQTLAITEHLDYPIAKAHAHNGISCCLSKLGDASGAQSHANQARAIYDDLGI